MCGIGAILDPAGTSGQHAAERMVEALRHRGPDGEALRRIGPVALAHTRLAIIDVAGGDQPLDSEDGRVTAIVNGEIYASLGQEVARRYAPRSPLGERIDPAAAARLVDEHCRGRADHEAVLYCLLEFSEWHASFVEAREPVAA
jgi:Glutamine amidotransferase domain